MSVNSVVIVGNLTRDVELRRTSSGMPIMNIGVAVNNRRKNSQTGEWEDEPCFLDCVMFGSRAESVASYIHKGSKVTIQGKLRYNSWEDKQTGQKRSKVEVVVDEIDFMSKGGGNSGGYQQQTTPAVQEVEAELFDESIPF